MERYDIAIVGGGVIGCQIAHELAPSHDVVVVERETVASGASGRAAGNVSPVLFYAYGQDRPTMAETIRSFLAEFEHGPFRFDPHDRIELLAGDRGDAPQRATELRAEGFDVSYLDPAAFADAYPYFDGDDYDGAVLFRDGGWIDPHTYTTALRDAAIERGAEFVSNTAVKGIDTADGDVEGVTTADGRYGADRVIAAAGWRTADLLEGVELPIAPYRTQIVVLEAALPDGFPIGRATDKGLYFRPERNGDLLVGGGGTPIDTDPEAASRDADESFHRMIAETVPTLLPEFDAAGVVNGWAGLDAASPDGYGIVDAPIEGPDGLIVATGFTGLGVMTAPAVPPVVRSLMGEGDCPYADFFSLDRFEDATVGTVNTFDH